MTLQDILRPLEDDMHGINDLIRQRLSSDVVLINQLSEHIIASGGKRLRPALVVMAMRALGATTGPAAWQLAAVIEFIHTATLLHDDVVDHSELRRGQATANALWGNEASVLTGDFLYSRAFQLMVELDQMEILKVLADTTNVIAEGEVLQLLNCHNPDITEADYFQVIERKTAILFEAAARCGGLLAGAEANVVEALAAYGRCLGLAFQLIDDCLDYSADADAIGKNLGDDLAEGKSTLPLIKALEASDGDAARLLQDAIRNGDRGQLPQVIQLIESAGGIPYTAERAQAYAEQAIAALHPLPASPARDSLARLAEFSARRQH